MFKITLEWEICKTGEKGKVEQELPFEIFKKVADVLCGFVGISIAWPKKGSGG